MLTYNKQGFLLGFLYVLILISTIILWCLGYEQNYNLKPSIGWIELVSGLFFIASIIYAFKNFNNYIVALIFNFLALPSSVDNLIPSVLITAPSDIVEVYYPIISHIDIFLIFGLLRFADFRNKSVGLKNKFYFVLLLVLFLISIIYNTLRLFDLYDTTLILANSYHLRYLLLLILLVTFKKENIKHKYIFIGIILSVIFLLVESTIFTHFVVHKERLISGTLRNNTFANFLTSIMAYLLMLIFNKHINKTYLLAIPILFIFIILTQCRSALFLAVMTLIVYVYFVLRRLKKKGELKKGLIFLFLLLSILTVYFNYASKTERLKITNFKIEKIDLSKDKLNEMIVFEDNDFTNSLSLRLGHFQTSINMIKSEPIFGIGAGRWNIHKRNFGSKDNNLMDAHNDFLAVASQYGIPIGIILIFCIFIIPFSVLFRIEHTNWEPINLLISISFIMLIAGLTNAALFKHQILSFLLFIALVNIDVLNQTKRRV